MHSRMKVEILKGTNIRERERTNVNLKDRGSCAKQPELSELFALRQVLRAVGY